MLADHALSSFSTHKKKFGSPTALNLNTYKNLVNGIDTISPFERRFLDHIDDLIVMKNQQNQPQDDNSRTWPLNSKAVTLFFLLIIPLSASSMGWLFSWG